jgi:hypothetical protein
MREGIRTIPMYSPVPTHRCPRLTNETGNPFCSRVLFPRLFLHSHLLLDLGNGQARVETLGAGPCAVKNGVATVQAHRVVQSILPLGLPLVSGINQPPVRLQQDGGSEVLLRVPPVRWARGRAAGAENALIEAIKLPPVLLALAEFLALWSCQQSYEELQGIWSHVWCWSIPLQVRLDRLVLLVEVRQVGDQVLDDVSMWQGVNLHLLVRVGRNAA